MEFHEKNYYLTFLALIGKRRGKKVLACLLLTCLASVFQKFQNSPLSTYFPGGLFNLFLSPHLSTTSAIFHSKWLKAEQGKATWPWQNVCLSMWSGSLVLSTHTFIEEGAEVSDVIRLRENEGRPSTSQ